MSTVNLLEWNRVLVIIKEYAITEGLNIEDRSREENARSVRVNRQNNCRGNPIKFVLYQFCLVDSQNGVDVLIASMSH